MEKVASANVANRFGGKAGFLRRSSASSPDDPNPCSTTKHSTFSAFKKPSIRPFLSRQNSSDTSSKSAPGSGNQHPFKSRAFKKNIPPVLTVQEATPDQEASTSAIEKDSGSKIEFFNNTKPLPNSARTNVHQTNPTFSRQAAAAAELITYSLADTRPTVEQREEGSTPQDYFGRVVYTSSPNNMARRKIWVKRQGASPTLVQIGDEDVVDDMKDMVLRKYANSLGRSFDAPDISIRIIPREPSHQSAERHLNPEESISRVLDAYFPGGQTVEEALVIEMPQRRTPRPSPRGNFSANSYFEDQRPLENGTDYFPLMPSSQPPGTSHDNRHAYQTGAHPHSMSIVETGQLPPLPSPRERKVHTRPKFVRNHTSSPTIVGTSANPTSNPGSAHPQRQQRARVDSMNSNHAPTPPPIPTPPAPETASKTISNKASSPPVDIVSPPRPVKTKTAPHKPHKADSHHELDPRKNSIAPQLLPGLLDGVVPPINVLIVEDNIINLKLLEANVKRLKVRWQTAMNGREAVNKWRAGGFHLVLMDIQLPIMNGLQATKEIRRLERVNGIGVFAKSEEERASTPKPNGESQEQSNSNPAEEAQEDDKLNVAEFFKSPVIIVALTASSLQSDRHEALAAGCNDFLTKPVNREWFERKVMEWGCMQALIDFDGWRQWKAFAEEKEEKQKAENQKDSDPEAKAKQERKEARRAALLAKMGQG